MPYVGQKLLFSVKRSVAAGLFACASLCLSTPVFAQDNSKTETLPDSKVTEPTDGLTFNLPGTTNFQSQNGPQIEIPLEAVGSSMFEFDLTSSGCAASSESCLRREDSTEIGLQDTFRRHSEKGLDLSLTPRASIRFNDEVSSTAVGAVIEIGEDLREGSEFKSNTWYFFAGADAEALTFTPGSIDRITSGEFHLQDRIIVGDAQAGLGYRIGDADVSLSYNRREASTEEFKFKEDAATLSFTWKR